MQIPAKRSFETHSVGRSCRNSRNAGSVPAPRTGDVVAGKTAAAVEIDLVPV